MARVHNLLPVSSRLWQWAVAQDQSWGHLQSQFPRDSVSMGCFHEEPRVVPHMYAPRKVVELPGKGHANSKCARPVY